MGDDRGTTVEESRSPAPANGVNDVAEFDKTTPITVVATFEDDVHVLRPVGLPIEVRRWLDGDDLVWQYVGVTCRPVSAHPR